MLNQLIHKGVIVPTPPGPYNLILTVRGQPLALTPEQEEMAIAWARKLGTPYVDDPVFARNFMADFSAALGIEPPLRVDEVDFSPAAAVIAAERAARERLSKEERKALAAERKAIREGWKVQYGHATVDGVETDIGTYLVEPSGIFMGRGKHPLRGRWKEGPKQRDITLNLSDPSHLDGVWAAIVWESESMWIARWKDKLSGKTKYIWLADTAPVKQQKEAHKFDKATALDANLAKVRAHITAALEDGDPERRMVATACYLIDKLCLRVGDEKDPDEADTVGATTLRPEHVTLHDDGTAEFRFLGKDSVLWHKKVELPEAVQRNLAELRQNARPSRNGRQSAAGDRPQLFPDIGSRDVNAFLSRVQKGLTAKVFRTHHATVAVRETLERASISPEDADYKKRAAAVQANLAAAVLCNHYKQAPANWPARQEKVRARKQELAERVEQLRAEAQACKEALSAARSEGRAKAEAAATEAARERAQAALRKNVERAKKKLQAAQGKLQRAEESLDRFKSQTELATKSRTWNLGTSLKSYIDPRVYYDWGRQVDYDVLASYYPKTLQSKFAWVRDGEEESEEPEEAFTEEIEP